LNYFSYFTEIEDTFVRRRGKHLLLSSIDWALIETWKDRGVPLHVVLRGIEHAFDSHDAKKRKRSVKTLLYCEEEVEAQYAEWLESRVGAHDEAKDGAAQTETQNSPFGREAVLKYLHGSRESLVRLNRERQRENDDALAEALGRAATLMGELEEDYRTAAQPDARKLEESLTGIERLLAQTIDLIASDSERAALHAAIIAQLKPYKRQMDKAVYQQALENLMRQRLREFFGIPRLSLFFLH
jgi:hypothetical protein